MDAIVSHARALKESVSLPADKAICHRAALLCALSRGSTTISPWSSAEDCQHTLAVLQQLGVESVRVGQGVRIRGVGLTGLRAPSSDLYCGDSGTTMRLLAGVLAGQPFASRLTAGESLRERPMQRIIDPLTQMGASFEGTIQPSRDITPPLRVQGRRPLNALTYSMPVASAQVKSAILLAGLYSNGPTMVVEPLATRDHTERLLKRLGVAIHQVERAITLHPPHGPLQAPEHLAVPSDPSSAAFFIVAASALPGSRFVVEDVSVNPTRLHFLDVLQRMGASIRVERDDNGWEPRGTITVEHRPLRGIPIARSEVPALVDELPILMVAACAAEGQTSFEGLGELRVKETDRLHAMATGLTRLGARLELRGEAGLLVSHSPLRGATVESYGDHRTAMSLAIAGLLAAGRTTITGAECIRKSFGTFFELLASVVGSDAVKTVDRTN